MSMEAYRQKCTVFEQATAERTQTIGKLHATTKAMMQSPHLFHFSNCTGGGFPPEVALNHAAPTANANEWPTAQQIQAVLVRWHTAREAALNAWRALSPEEQKVMRPLEAFYDPDR